MATQSIRSRLGDWVWNVAGIKQQQIEKRDSIGRNVEIIIWAKQTNGAITRRRRKNDEFFHLFSVNWVIWTANLVWECWKLWKIILDGEMQTMRMEEITDFLASFGTIPIKFVFFSLRTNKKNDNIQQQCRKIKPVRQRLIWIKCYSEMKCVVDEPTLWIT